MRTVKLNFEKLLAALRANRTTHIAEYNEAMVGYREKATAELTELLRKVAAGEQIDRTLMTVAPTSHETDYDTAIKMIDMGEDAVIELTMEEFNQYVEDNWDWKRAFQFVNSTYKK